MAILLLVVGSWLNNVDAERPATAPRDTNSALLQLRHNGGAAIRHRGRKAASLSAGTAEAGSAVSSLQNKTGIVPVPKNHFPKVDEWLNKFDQRIDKWHEYVQGNLTEKAVNAIDKSLDYMKKPIELKNALHAMQGSVGAVREATENMHNEEMNAIGDLLAGAKGPKPEYVPDSFAVPRPGSKHQPGDEWDAPPTMEDLQDENTQLKAKVLELQSSKAALEYKHGVQAPPSQEETAPPPGYGKGGGEGKGYDGYDRDEEAHEETAPGHGKGGGEGKGWDEWRYDPNCDGVEGPC